MIEQSFRVTQPKKQPEPLPERPVFSVRTAQETVFVVFMFAVIVFIISVQASTIDR